MFTFSCIISFNRLKQIAVKVPALFTLHHKGTFSHSLLSFAGFDLNNVMDDLVYYDFTDNEWVPVTPAGEKPVSTDLILSGEER